MLLTGYGTGINVYRAGLLRKWTNMQLLSSFLRTWGVKYSEPISDSRDLLSEAHVLSVNVKPRSKQVLGYHVSLPCGTVYSCFIFREVNFGLTFNL
jgi:hypothetical protein